MTNFTPVRVVRVSLVTPHPHAKRLDICYVDGTQYVTAKGQFKDNDLAFLFSPAAILPNNVIEELGVQKYIGPDGRVGLREICGFYSFGILHPVTREDQETFFQKILRWLTIGGYDRRWLEGDDASEAWGVRAEGDA